MQTCFSPDDIANLPILCTIFVHYEDLLGAGTVWASYLHRCHGESQLAVIPGMMVSLSVYLPGTGWVGIEQGLATWARASESGIPFTQNRP